MIVIKKLIINFSYKQLIAAYFNLGLALKNSNSIVALKKYMIGIYYNMLICDLTYTVAQIKIFFNLIHKVYNSNGKILFINENSLYLTQIKSASNLHANISYHIGKWLPNNLLNVRKSYRKNVYVNFGTTFIHKNDMLYSNFNFKKLPSVAFLLNYRDTPSLKSIVYEFKKIRIPLLTMTNTDADPITIDYWSFFNNKSFRSVALMMSLTEKLILKLSINNKRIFLGKIIENLNEKVKAF